MADNQTVTPAAAGKPEEAPKGKRKRDQTWCLITKGDVTGETGKTLHVGPKCADKADGLKALHDGGKAGTVDSGRYQIVRVLWEGDIEVADENVRKVTIK